MKKTAMWKTSIREIWQSKARFFSILGIIFLGVAFFVGIGATGPDMIQTGDRYFREHQLADTTMVSTLGIVDKDIEQIKELPEVLTATPQYTKDVNITEKNSVIRFFGFNQKKPGLNQYIVQKGRLPEKSGEIALDSLAQRRGSYKLGDSFTLEDKDDTEGVFKKDTYKIVGFVKSPEYIENASRGNTNVGTGSIDFFAVIPETDLDLSTYSRVLIRYKNTEKMTAYSKEYEARVKKNEKALKQQLKNRPNERLKEIQTETKEEIEEAQEKIDTGEKALSDGEKKLADSRKELEEGKKKLAASQTELNQKIASGQATIDENQVTLDGNQATLNQQTETLKQKKAELAAAEPQIEEAKQTLTDLTTQQAELQRTAGQLDSALSTYQVIEGLLKQVEAGADEEFTAALEQVLGSLSGLLTQIDASPELQAAVNQLSQTMSEADLARVLQQVEVSKNTLVQQQKELTAGLQQIQTGIITINQQVEAYNAGQTQISTGELQLQMAQLQLDNGQDKLTTAQKELTAAKNAGQTQIDSAKKQLDEGQKAYEEGLKTFEKEKKENQPKLDDAKKKVKDAEKRVADLKPAELIFSSRNDNPGYTEYKENANRISSLATVFPIIFFLIAALVSLTTMTRMVEEKRSEIGTFKALGYKNGEIAQKFLLYSFSAGLTGSIAGLALGFYLFPSIIFSAYGQMYNLDGFQTPWYWSYSLIAIAVALLCTVGTATLVVRIDLFSTAANLLRPKAPKAGQRILLERVTPVWKRLNFIQKVTMRNLFRYKQRMLMTILGIAGCMSMIITGFGIRDSVSDVVNVQFNKLWHYQAIVTFNEDASSEETKDYQAAIDKLDNFQDSLLLSTETLTLSESGKTSQDVSVYVPMEPENISKFVLFNDRETGEKYSLSDDGVIINEKLSKLFDLKVGDTIELANSDKKKFNVKISAIAENYTGHFAYMTPTYYEKIFKKSPVYNSDILLFTKDLGKETENSMAQELMDNPKVINVAFLTQSINALDDTIGSLNIVIWVLIISAGMLAFIVLYNLTNINISERIRELSTIKVLGFYDKELIMYVYRENIILTALGIFVGLFLGKWEHGYILQTVEVDMVMFSPEIHWLSYVYSSLITILFTFIVGVVMYYKLKKVDMIEALKSNE
ncbi:permease [Enterococcus sp. JM4C]|nr:FtsX-like permease family protein [Enterococcus sp. JM4C]KAF1297707.1 permease [Enterococcus sp. JM4C]